jgi:hypothetical protein
MRLCLADLASLVDGTLRFGSMPPVDGIWTAVGRIVLDSRLVSAGDVFWRVPGLPWQTACSPQHAMFRGAAGVVTSDPDVVPWPGTFCLEVGDSLAALVGVLQWLDGQAGQRNPEELKDLQLCPPRAPDITPPTCGRPADERFRSRCERRSA